MYKLNTFAKLPANMILKQENEFIPIIKCRAHENRNIGVAPWRMTTDWSSPADVIVGEPVRSDWIRTDRFSGWTSEVKPVKGEPDNNMRRGSGCLYKALWCLRCRMCYGLRSPSVSCRNCILATVFKNNEIATDVVLIRTQLARMR